MNGNQLTVQAHLPRLQGRRNLTDRDGCAEEGGRQQECSIHEGADASFHRCDVSLDLCSKDVQLTCRYVEDASLGSSSTSRDDPVVPGSAPPSTNALVAIVEKGMGGMAYDERVRIGLVSVVPITGDVVWDEFDGEFVILP